MKIKNFLIALSIVIIFSFIFIIFGQQKPETIQNLVTSTNEQIQNFKENLLDAERKDWTVDQKLLDILDFTEFNPRLFPKDIWTNTSLPVIVTYILEGSENQIIGFIINIGKILPNNTILIYNLGLADYSLLKVQNYCNNSHCQIINFDFSNFPSHIQDDSLHAFRPVLIQDALSHTGSILFIECSYRLLDNVSYETIKNLYEKRVMKQGILAFALKNKNPVTSLTHKKMFEYFHTEAENFQFLQMITADVLFIVNTKDVHQEIMLPWIQCTLTQDCIFPIGSQSVGCKYKKPSYRYSGCHYYDISALNIILGLKFKFKSNDYTYSRTAQLFKQIPPQTADAILKLLEKNSTADGQLSVVN